MGTGPGGRAENRGPARFRILHWAGLFVALLILLLHTAPAAEAAPLEPIDPFRIGKTVDFRIMRTLDGGKFNFADYRGKKILIVAFWLPTCDTCLQQIERLEKFLDSDGRRKDIELITVNRGKTDLEKDYIRNILNNRKLKFKVALDPDILLARHFGATEVPAYALVDKNGRLAAPVAQYPDLKTRDYSLLDFADLLREGEKIPHTQFLPYPEDSTLKAMIGKPAPEFTLASTQGEQFNLSDYKDKKGVVLVFWHPYCTYCWGMMKKLADYYEKNGPEYDFVLASVASIYGPAQEDELARFLQESGAKYPVLNDADSSLGEKYNIRKIPQVYFIDKKGNIVEIQTGEQTGFDTRFTPFIEQLGR